MNQKKITKKYWKKIRARNDFLESEIQHLLNIKADNKIVITYPQLGEENDLVNNVQERIKQYTRKLTSIYENYLLILEFATRKSSKSAIRFKGYFFDNSGKLINTIDKIIFQAK